MGLHASACIGMTTRLGLGRLKHVEIKHVALQHWIRQERLTLDKVNDDRTVGRHHDKTLFTQNVTTLARLSHQLQ